jgi:4-oxalocrotonate tautomerase
MPTLCLKISPPQDAPRYAALAVMLTGLASQLLGKKAGVTAVVIEEVPAAKWFVAGSEVRQATALLEISITQGTNTHEEKSAFVQAAFAQLAQLLGQPAGQAEEASYVIVRELPATDWGYGGHTQAGRKAAAAPALPQ